MSKPVLVIDYDDAAELEGLEVHDGARELLDAGEVTDEDVALARRRWGKPELLGNPPRGHRHAVRRP